MLVQTSEGGFYMKISLTLIMVSAVLTAGGFTDRALYSLGAGRRHAYYFLFCAFALDRFTLGRAGSLEVSAACALMAVLMTAAYLKCEKNLRRALKTLCLCIAVGLPVFMLSRIGGDLGGYFAALVLASAAALFGLERGLAICALAPVSAAALGFAAETYVTGVGEFVLSEQSLIIQTAALLFSFISYPIVSRLASPKGRASRTIS
jgi:hypothetical protein